MGVGIGERDGGGGRREKTRAGQGGRQISRLLLASVTKHASLSLTDHTALKVGFLVI